jgi:uncharacterized protein
MSDTHRPDGAMLRPIERRDHAFVLELNRAFEHLTAPMDEVRLLQLLAWAESAVIIDAGQVPAGFVLTIAAGSAYDSVNYLAFSQRFDTFTYLDRIVIDTPYHRQGLGRFAYDELEATASARMLLEVNIDPPNEPSLNFHRARGYSGIAEIDHSDHRSLMMCKELTPPVETGLPVR